MSQSNDFSKVGRLRSSTIKILIVDDHRIVRSGVRSLLADVDGIEVVAEAQSGEEAIDYCRKSSPDVVMMDIKMPGIGGYEATRKLLRYNSDIKVLVMSVCDDDLLPSRLLQAGAFGYLTKDASKEDMVRAIRAVNSSQRYISKEIAIQLALKHLQDDSENPFDLLSERELQVSMMITNGVKVQVVSEQLHLSPKTVNSYRYRIFEKLNISSDVELTRMAIKFGLLEDIT